MKIGEFAKKYNVTIDTLRYYIKLNLLIPEREGIRYNFNDSCHKNMEQILYYKSLRFSIQEIVRLMSVNYLFNGVYRIKKNAVLRVLENKSYEVERRIKKEQLALSRLKKQIKKMKTEHLPDKEVYLPLSVLELFCCPDCNNRLSPNSKSHELGILKDSLTCDCGFTIQIDRNILTIENRDPGLKLDDPINFIVQFLNSNEGSEIVDSLDSLIFQESNRYSRKSGNILCLQNLPVIPNYEIKKESYYILVSSDKDYLQMVYESLSKFGGLEHFILFNSSIEQLPLKQGSVSSIYDFFYSDITAITKKSRFLEKLTPLLTEDGDYLHIGLFLDKSNGKYTENLDIYYQFYQSVVTQQFQSKELIPHESLKKLSTTLDKLLSKTSLQKLNELGYKINLKDKAYIQSQLYLKQN